MPAKFWTCTCKVQTWAANKACRSCGAARPSGSRDAARVSSPPAAQTPATTDSTSTDITALKAKLKGVFEARDVLATAGATTQAELLTVEGEALKKQIRELKQPTTRVEELTAAITRSEKRLEGLQQSENDLIEKLESTRSDRAAESQNLQDLKAELEVTKKALPQAPQLAQAALKLKQILVAGEALQRDSATSIRLTFFSS